MRILILSCVVWASVCQASFEIYLKDANKIPLYAQQTGVWCGAGSAQMMLEGYPNDVNHPYEQKFIWNTIQPLKVETSWYTDPDGLKRVMDKLGGGNAWRVRCSKQGPNPLLSSFVKNMKQQRYPVSVLVYGSGHWVVVIGVTTDQDPNVSQNLVLEKIEAHDPWKAQHVLVDGKTWLKKYWPKTARTRGKWSGCYVSVERILLRDDKELKVTIAEASTVKSEALLSEKEVLQKVPVYLKELTRQHPQFADLTGTEVVKPRLVSHFTGDYFLVPLSDRITGLSRGAVTVDAYTGEWQGLVQFQTPMNYLTEEEGTRVALVKGPTYSEWVFDPSVESPSPFLPVLKLNGGEQKTSVFVDQDRKVSTELHPLPPGS